MLSSSFSSNSILAGAIPLRRLALTTQEATAIDKVQVVLIVVVEVVVMVVRVKVTVPKRASTCCLLAGAAGAMAGERPKFC